MVLTKALVEAGEELFGEGEADDGGETVPGRAAGAQRVTHLRDAGPSAARAVVPPI